MPRVEQNGMPTSLHYALTDSQCSKCGKQLEWNAKELKLLYEQELYILLFLARHHLIFLLIFRVQYLLMIKKEQDIQRYKVCE